MATAPSRPTEAQAVPRALMLETAIVLVKNAVPKSTTMTATTPAVRMSICQAITRRKMAPVHGLITMLTMRSAASL